MIQDTPVSANTTSVPPERRLKRPALITILSILHLTGSGLFIIGFTLRLFERGFAKADMLSLVVGIPLASFFAGIGMLSGKAWGWWISLFLYMAWIEKNLIVLLIKGGVIPTSSFFSLGPFGDYQNLYYIAIGALIVYGAILSSLLNGKVLDYFVLGKISKKKVICTTFTGVNLFIAIGYLINAYAS